jgi:hypothetical protein
LFLLGRLRIELDDTYLGSIWEDDYLGVELAGYSGAHDWPS